MKNTLNGIILSCIGGRYTVLSNDLRYSCYAKGSFRHQGIKPHCGDYVSFVPGASFPNDGSSLPPSKENDGYLTEVLKRKNILRRPPIANIDTLLIVAASANPAPDTVYIDRLTVCAKLANITPILIFNKFDLAPNIANELTSLYRSAGFSAFPLSADNINDSDVELLRALLQGKTTALAGFSGVGKTTIFNLIFPHYKGEVGELSAKLSRGKNTTRSTELHSLRQSVLNIDGLFADTAGFSRLELGRLDEISANDLVYYFPEFEEFLCKCQFTKCTHQTEVGCAIRQAVDKGLVSESRYKSFQTLYEELKKQK